MHDRVFVLRPVGERWLADAAAVADTVAADVQLPVVEQRHDVELRVQSLSVETSTPSQRGESCSEMQYEEERRRDLKVKRRFKKRKERLTIRARAEIQGHQWQFSI